MPVRMAGVAEKDEVPIVMEVFVSRRTRGVDDVVCFVPERIASFADFAEEIPVLVDKRFAVLSTGSVMLPGFR